MQTDTSSTPFEFSITFNINRNNVIINKVLTPVQIVQNIN